ncbi:MAG: hypothetical protein MUF71_21395 [Candidatus Kapabacteria bacterium]|nr:hypothetical protein [Candidatus Kapabacteria bacterium]
MGNLQSQETLSKKTSTPAPPPKRRYLRWIASIVGVVISVIAFLMIAYSMYAMFFVPKGNVNYVGIAIALLVTWFTVLLIYFSWAIYFYNVNLGFTNEEWEQIKAQDNYNPQTHTPENPHKDETLGLPNGTVRGTIALTLLVCSIALMIIGFDKEYAPILASQFDFFITAFQMMIAFYFGNKALDIFKDKPQGDTAPSLSNTPSDTPAAASGVNSASDTDTTTVG